MILGGLFWLIIMLLITPLFPRPPAETTNLAKDSLVSTSFSCHPLVSQQLLIPMSRAPSGSASKNMCSGRARMLRSQRGAGNVTDILVTPWSCSRNTVIVVNLCVTKEAQLTTKGDILMLHHWTTDNLCSSKVVSLFYSRFPGSRLLPLRAPAESRSYRQ